MAAIDKFYSSDKELVKRILTKIAQYDKVFICTYLGHDFYFNPNNYLYLKLQDIDDLDWSKERPIWNSPCYMDKWLYENFQEFPEVIQDIKEKYNIECSNTYTKKSLFSNVNSSNPIFSLEELPIGKHFKIIKKPHRIFNRLPCKGRLILQTWSDGYYWYNENIDDFVPGNLPCTSSGVFLKYDYVNKHTIKKIVEKYNFPIGITIHLGGKYVDQDWFIRIKK